MEAVPEKSRTRSKRAGKPELPPEAQRALAEAEERRRKAAENSATAVPKPKEIGGPEGPEPTRYGDWESKGIISDF
jgi:hypothetical protein